MKTKYLDYNYIRKVGEYEFLVKVQYMPLFIIKKQVRVSIVMIPTKESIDSYKRSVIVSHSKIDYIVQKFISSYLEELNYFKITLT
jgi:hypothetical protein